MTGFTNLTIRKAKGSAGGRQLWRLDEPLRYQAALNGAGGIGIHVPRGFVTDFASVPRFLWPIFPPAGPWAEAAVIHDYLYSLPNCSRFLADAIFRECMYQLGVPLWRRVSAYYAVRLFGRRRKICG